VDLLVAWFLFAAVAVAVSLGHGLLIERASGTTVPGVLLAPLGLAGVICTGQLTTWFDGTAELTVPLILLVAVAGLALGARRLRRARPDGWLLAAALGVFAVYAAPTVLGGSPTLAGYGVLGDTVIHLVGADALLEYGRDFSGLAPSSYRAILDGYYGANAYPSGGAVVVGALTRLVGQDPAATFQPFLALLMTMMALCLAHLARVAGASLRGAGIIAFVAAQPALVYGFALQGSLKELGTAFSVALVAASFPVFISAIDADRTSAAAARATLPLSISAAAMIGIVGIAAGVWLAPLALVGFVVSARLLRRARVVLGAAMAFGAVSVALCFQAIADLATYVDVAGGVVTSQNESGNLLGPLRTEQLLGVWISDDYRSPPIPDSWAENATRPLMWVVAIAASWGALMLIRRRKLWPLAYVAVSALACVYIVRSGSPWADGKALMIFSPAVLFSALLGARAMQVRTNAIVVALLIAGGVLWSNALAYHAVSSTPQERFDELATAGDRVAGLGPTLAPEFEEFAKHFLRDGAPEVPADAWRSQDTRLRHGAVPVFGYSNDIDEFRFADISRYRSLVLRRGPEQSRPPSTFRRVWQGEHYEVWRRVRTDVVAHLSVGRRNAADGIPSCEDVRALAHRGRTLRYVPRPRTVRVSPTRDAAARGVFLPDPADPDVLRTIGPMIVEGRMPELPERPYEMWLEGSFGRAVKVSVDGRETGRISYALNSTPADEPVGDVPSGASAGDRLIMTRACGSMRAGDAGTNRKLGPLSFVPRDALALPIRTLPAAEAADLCGRRVDWVEAVR